MSNGSEEFYLELRHNGENAYLFTDGVEEFWLPKSCIIEMEKVKGNDYKVEIPYWLALKKGMI